MLTNITSPIAQKEIPSFKYGLQFWNLSGTNLTLTSIWPQNSSNIDETNYIWNQTLACHFELPFPSRETQAPADFGNAEFVKISALPFRGYSFIANEYFLPEFCSDRLLFSKTDNGSSGDNMSLIIGVDKYKRWNDVDTPAPFAATIDGVNIGGVCIPVSRAHRSLWTSCLPKPSLETLNLLGTVDNAPVGFIPTADQTMSTSAYPGIAAGVSVQKDKFKQSLVINATGTPGAIAKINEAVLTVNNYRETILLQNYYDCLNRAGSRYDEIIANLFHVRTSMAVIDIPELIVHKRFTIYRKEVVATAQTNDQSDVVKPLGSQASYIDTVIKDDFFIKSTTEHGYIHLLYCIRPSFIRMCSGFEPEWMNLNKLDQFYPQFQGMGDVPRKKMEVSYGFSGNRDSQSAILGYQEYSAEYKYQRNSAVGWFDVNTPNPLKGFNIVDEFANTQDVTLDNYWISCATEEISFANCLAIPSPLLAPQFIVDIRMEGTIYHPMKVYNIPGQGDLL